MSLLLSKIVLGTVQFGLNYGINNASGKISFDEVQRIFALCKIHGIKKLDTSQSYGNSEDVLGQSTNSKFQIISKYSDTHSAVSEAFHQSLTLLKTDKLYGYLVHHFNSFREQPAIWDQMVSLRNAGLVEKTGFSLYEPEELEYLFDKNIDFDLIQFPYNIFDRSFEPYLKELRQRNIEIHVRSVFLQGLFFKNPNKLSETLLPLSPYLKELNSFCKEENMSIEELALNAVIHNEFIDGVLIGVDNESQLMKNIEIIWSQYSTTIRTFVDSINVKEKKLLKPVNWN